MLEMNLVRTKEEENRKYEVYEIEGYSVYVTIYDDGEKIISVSTNIGDDEYTPDIYFEDGEFGSKEKKFKIQTTSYGALGIEEIEKFMAAYKKAVEAANVLTKEFIA